MANALSFIVNADTSRLVANMVAAGDITERQGKRMVQQIGYISQELKRVQQTQEAANDAVASTEKNSKAMEHFGFQTAAAKRELLVLTHELSQGNYSRFGSSLLVLGERTGAASLLFSAMGAAALGVVAVLGGFAAALLMGAKEQKAFNDSLLLTGNYAGITADKFNALAVSAANATKSTVGHGKETLQSLIDTGAFGPEALNAAVTASLNLQKISGQTADEVAKDFAKMQDGVAKFAAEHVKRHHDITLAQFQYIKSLEDAGRMEDAQVELLKTIGDKAKQTSENIGYMAAAWRWATDEASKFWNFMKDFGKSDTTQQQLEALQKTLAQKQAQGPLNDLTRDAYNKGIERLKQEIYLLQEKLKLENKSAQLQAQQGAADAEAIKKIMAKPGKAEKPEFPYAITNPQREYNQRFLMTEIAAYDELKKSEDRAAEAAAKLAIEQEKSFDKWFESYNAKQMDANADPMEARTYAMGKYLREVTNQTKRAEELVSGAMGRMEDAIVNFAKTGKLSFSDLWGFMAEEYIRNLIRMMEQKYLLDAAGNFSFAGLGNLWSGVKSFFGFANGLDYVPYDGFPAILHQGERVQTAIEARGGSSGKAMNFDFSGQVLNVGAGVNRAEVDAAVKRGNAETEMRIRRLIREGVLS